MTASATPPALSPEQIRREMQGIDWWHQIDLGQGVVTPGRGGSTQARIDLMRMPADLTGLTVLDIGAWDGAFSFAAERRGAARIVAVNEKPKPGLDLARRVLGSKVESVQMDMMKLTPEAVGGPFDVVFFLGVLYHLPDPIGGLQRVRDLVAPGGLMIMETDTRLNHIRHPAAALVEDPRGPDNYDRNWWLPNAAGAVSMCRQVGFMRVEVVAPPIVDNATLPRRVVRRLTRQRGPSQTLRCTLHAWRAQAGTEAAALQPPPAY